MIVGFFIRQEPARDLPRLIQLKYDKSTLCTNHCGCAHNANESTLHVFDPRSHAGHATTRYASRCAFWGAQRDGLCGGASRDAARDSG